MPSAIAEPAPGLTLAAFDLGPNTPKDDGPLDPNAKPVETTPPPETAPEPEKPETETPERPPNEPTDKVDPNRSLQTAMDEQPEITRKAEEARIAAEKKKSEDEAAAAGGTKPPEDAAAKAAAD